MPTVMMRSKKSPTDCEGSGLISGEITLTMTMMTTKLKQSDSEGTGY